MIPSGQLTLMRSITVKPLQIILARGSINYFNESVVVAFGIIWSATPFSVLLLIFSLYQSSHRHTFFINMSI